jgi:SsrA-binding protein
MHKRQIARAIQAVDREGMTLVPLSIYFNERGRAKLELALGKGKKVHDKRESIKQRDWQRDQARLLRGR